MSRLLVFALAALLAPAALAGELSLIVSGHWLEKTGEDEFEGELEGDQVDFDFDVGGAAGVGLLWEFGEHWGLETRAAFGRMGVTVRIAISDAVGILDLGEADVIPLTAVLQYRFNPDGNWVPYLGAGAAHILISDLRVEGTDLEIPFETDSGLVLNAGFDYRLSTNFYFNADLKHVPFETGTESTSELGESSEIGFEPLLGSVGIRYRF